MERLGDILKEPIPQLPITKTETETEEEPVETCPVKCRYCNDARIVHPCQPDGKVDYSIVIPCHHCQSPESVCRALGISSLDATLDNLRPVLGLELPLKYARQLVTLKTAWQLFLIYGNNGNGKTHILEGIAIELWNKGIYARVRTFPDFMGQLKQTFDRCKDSTDQTFNEIIKSVCTMPFLLMDDVGLADSYTAFSQAQLERIIVARYRSNIFTVMTTNRDLSEMPNSVRSRFSDTVKARLVHNAAKDYRPLKGKK